MKAVVQIVEDAKLSVDEKIVSQIGKGMVIYFCAEKGDLAEKLDFFAKKLAFLRIFPDNNGKTNLSIKDFGGEILLVSQFTLAADCSGGNRPSFTMAEEPARAEQMYLTLAKILTEQYAIKVSLGVFGAEMKIKQTNMGPFTIVLQK